MLRLSKTVEAVKKKVAALVRRSGNINFDHSLKIADPAYQKPLHANLLSFF